MVFQCTDTLTGGLEKLSGTATNNDPRHIGIYYLNLVKESCGLHVHSTNSDPRHIGYYYLNLVKEAGGM